MILLVAMSRLCIHSANQGPTKCQILLLLTVGNTLRYMLIMQSHTRAGWHKGAGRAEESWEKVTLRAGALLLNDHLGCVTQAAEWAVCCRGSWVMRLSVGWSCCVCPARWRLHRDLYLFLVAKPADVVRQGVQRPSATEPPNMV